jgi:hypothetical protein
MSEENGGTFSREKQKAFCGRGSVVGRTVRTDYIGLESV